ncbi:5'-methylthioadenosine/adenosylhomocysteine nucleosidase [Bacillus nitratireducens]|uniref:5'-methylthioadenosine/adenosylhomocysteine nucleosidase n=1 Tax=Bacillus nitratireducens TaxID=2026193 RepID=UPI001F59F6C9|nr:5'-methylthioadenosine/adenosylhomocysteine nucleosidase [Bacillus nitratireducens]UNP78948.1 5'-methylthioadenosine/adenosylhomocysteine nucleosidase [Bacillus nitratireducens]
MNRIGIIGAMQIEIDLLLEKLHIKEKHTITGMPFYIGEFMGTEVIITRSGVGKVNAAACTQTLIHKFNVDAIINTGVAGGLHPDVKVGDIVISTNVTHHDVSKTQMKNLFPFQEEFNASKELIELARKACNSSSLHMEVHKGRIVSGECFVEDSKLKAKLIDEYAPHCTEIEGAAIGHVAYINEVPFLVIRCISDSADDEAQVSYDDFAKTAANYCSEIIVEMLKNISSNTYSSKGENGMLQALIFDMDGTLFQTDKILELSLDDTFDHLRSLQLWDTVTPIDKYREIMGVPLPKVWEALLPNHSLEVREQTDAYFLERLIENIKSGKGALYPNVKEVFTYIKESNCSIYIASNGLTEYLRAIVSYYALDQWVTETFSIEQINSLNKSDLVKSILNKYDIKEAAVVGDRLSDINAAKDNGLIAIGCNFDFAQEDELAQADIVIDDLMELKGILSEVQNTHVTN